MNLQPMDDHIIVEPESAESMTSSGIYLPDIAQEKPQVGLVLQVGKGRFSEHTGKRIQPTLIAGDRVMYTQYGGTEIEHEGQKLLFLREADVIARVVS